MVKQIEKKDLFHLKGEKSEHLALQYFLNSGYTLVSKNHLVNGIEIDLILKNKSEFLLVEVKSNNAWRLAHPVSKKQKERLFKAYACFCDTVEQPCRFLLAIVSQSSPQVVTYPLHFDEVV